MTDEKKRNAENTNETESDKYYFKIWKSYEDVAMHFNDLIIRLRIQSIGGLAALTAILGIFLNDRIETNSNSLNYCIATIALFILIMFWVGIFFLDIFYYNRLLEGAVNGILELERSKDEFVKNKDINLSTNIELAFRKRFNHEPTRFKRILNGRILFYIIVLIALLITFAISCNMMCKFDNKQNANSESSLQAEHKNLNTIVHQNEEKLKI